MFAGVEAREKYTKYKIEDTTGGVNCVHWNANSDSVTLNTRYSIGDLVCVTAKITEFRGHIELKIVEIFELVGPF